MNLFHLFFFVRQRSYTNYTKMPPTINTSLFGEREREGGWGQGVRCTINSPLDFLVFFFQALLNYSTYLRLARIGSTVVISF